MLNTDCKAHSAGLPKTISLDTGVHIWTICLETKDLTNVELLNLLSPDEITRATRYRFDRDRQRFITGRAHLRRILAYYLGCVPKALRFSYGPAGKPALSAEYAAAEIEFNLSNSGQWALLAVTQNRKIGVDLECVLSEQDLHSLAARFFAPTEAANLSRLNPKFFKHAFFACWTRKESFVKALGTGLGIPLDGFEVSVDPNAPARLLSTAFCPAAAERWSLTDVQLNPAIAHDFRASLCIEGSLPQLIHFDEDTSHVLT